MNRQSGEEKRNPSDVATIANLFERIRELEKMHKTNAKIAEYAQKDRKSLKMVIEWAVDELNHAYLTGDIANKDDSIKEVMRELEKSLGEY